ncbi:uncharacterized protein RG961_010150 isoform 2-T6 [Leptosomus discolor]
MVWSRRGVPRSSCRRRGSCLGKGVAVAVDNSWPFFMSPRGSAEDLVASSSPGMLLTASGSGGTGASTRQLAEVTHVALEGRSRAPTSGLRRRGGCQPGWRPRAEHPAAARSSVSVRLCRCYAAAFGVGCRKR